MTHNDTYAISVRVDDAYAERVPTCLVRRAVALTLAQHVMPATVGLTLLVTSDEDIHKLNKRFRGVDAPTDVLSFPAAGEGDDLPGFDEGPYLGDIIIAYPYMAIHAEEDGHAIAHVLVLLAVHGTLHLLGYDHDSTESQAEMWAAQEAILKEIDVPLSVIPPLHDYSNEDDQ
jgi:probable rRNA maturation factor